MLSLPQPQRRRRPSLTPMIDVVFLLLVFFMLAARFGAPDAIGTGIAGGGDWSGPPRLVTLRPDTLLLNGQPVAADALPGALSDLMQSTADAVLLLVDPIKQRRHELEPLIEQLAQRPEKKILVLNKVDIAKKEPLLALAQELSAKVDFAEIYFISALTGDGVVELKDALAAEMPDGEWMYPEDQVSDASERLLATEITREQLYRQLHEELPYDSMVRPEKYIERKDGSVEIHQQIIVARDNQRMIVLGKGGSMIKSIGQAAREELSELLGRKVHLFLHVKATENWAEDKEMFEEMGLDWVR